MSQVDGVEMQFSGADQAPELDDYRPISPLVILACVAGLASLLAVAHPLFWAVPVIAIVLSVCAIRQVSTPESRYSGRAGAVAALCLATLIGSYAPARAISLERTIYRRAQTQAEQWISLVQQGRYQEAHQFTLVVYERFEGPGRLSSHYTPRNRATQSGSAKAPNSMDEVAQMSTPSASDQLATFVQGSFIAKLIEFGEQGSTTHLKDVSIETSYGNLEVTQRFRMSGLRDGQPATLEFLLTSTRWETFGDPNWQIARFKELSE